FQPYNLDVLEYGKEFSKQYAEFTIDNVIAFIDGRDYKEQMRIIDTLWKYHIQYVPEEGDSRPLAEITKGKNEGDCTDHVRYIKEIADKLGYAVSIYVSPTHTSITVLKIEPAAFDISDEPQFSGSNNHHGIH
ncbi:MAG: hypothetical protein ABIH39_09045, partial [Candidatus Margulisiibacteriota bacterium]